MNSGVEQESPLVSIAMPFYNSAKTLRASIQSIRNQTYGNWELQMPDDGSTDGSVEIAQSFRDPRIIVWSDGQRKNLAARLNECIDRARGSLLARMDGDDLAYPERIERQVKFLNSNPEIDLVGTGMLVFGQDGQPLGKRLGPAVHAEIARRPTLCLRVFHPTFVGRLDWFRRYRYCVEAKLGQDQELLFRAHRDSRFANLPDILLGYRESSIDLKKVLRSRRLWVKHLSWHLKGPSGYARLAGAALNFTLRGLLDYLAVFTGLGYRLLPQRAEPITDSERQAWLEVWNQTGAGSPAEYPPNSARASSAR